MLCWSLQSKNPCHDNMTEMAEELQRIGFIGLGAMGYPMVQNLVKKLPVSSKIYVFDVIDSALKRIDSESDGKVAICQSAKEVATHAVSSCHPAL